jgi:NADH-quinone oxidoreductase subunit H
MNTIATLLLVIMPALAVVAFLTLFERNVIATLQRRVGPNLVLISGGGQAVADALKLMMKELILPCIANSSLF